ncbi:hypothetical protein [Chitinophaga sp. MM2321]|uniref:hypothetical protein n=1 Tax=Chitinophaga sp. MM2321 TaxID=3137178 RepID=UPI0032D5A411
MQVSESPKKRVVVVYWKGNHDNPFEVFSSLKNFCLSYKEYNYNTLCNYLSKEKIAYDNEKVRIERKNVFLKPKTTQSYERKIMPVVRRVSLKAADDYMHDLSYWLTKTPLERLSAVTFLIRQSLKKGQRLDKTKMARTKLKI